MADLKSFIAKVAGGEPLNRDEARNAFGVMMSGDATPSQIGGFLMALRVRVESVDEIYGAVSVMREKMLPVKAPTDAVDRLLLHACTLQVPHPHSDELQSFASVCPF